MYYLMGMLAFIQQTVPHTGRSGGSIGVAMHFVTTTALQGKRKNSWKKQREQTEINQHAGK